VDVRFLTPTPAKFGFFSRNLHEVTHGAPIASVPCVMSPLQAHHRPPKPVVPPRRPSGVHRRAPARPEIDEFAGLDRLDRAELDEDFEPPAPTSKVA
jgi:hypothetical protein